MNKNMSIFAEKAFRLDEAHGPLGTSTSESNIAPAFNGSLIPVFQWTKKETLFSIAIRFRFKRGEFDEASAETFNRPFTSIELRVVIKTCQKLLKWKQNKRFMKVSVAQSNKSDPPSHTDRAESSMWTPSKSLFQAMFTVPRRSWCRHSTAPQAMSIIGFK